MNWIPNNIFVNLLEKGVPFIVFKNPNTESVTLLVQKSSAIQRFSIEEIEQKKGFVIAPFDSARTGEFFLLKPDFTLKGEMDISKLEVFLENLPVIHPKTNGNNHQSSKNEYLEKAEYFIQKIRSGEFNKIVLSRVLSMEIAEAINYSKFFNQLCLSNKSAFVYLLFTPDHGIWSGATPETLLTKNGEDWETMAVAGTRLLTDFQSDNEWGEKEVEEQQMVSAYIEKLLSELGVKHFKMLGPKTITAGQIVHLKTSFSIEETCLKNRLGIFIKGLHPTPAVCGLPKASAYHLIEKAESHDRKLYTGFLGPWGLEGEFKLFVNLRCAQFTHEKIMVFVGGGLTKDSVSEDEWQETKNKSRTLLSVVENL